MAEKYNLNVPAIRGSVSPNAEFMVVFGGDEVIKDHINNISGEKKRKFIAFLYTLMSVKKVRELVGCSYSWIKTCADQFPEMTAAAQVSRQIAIASMTEQKAWELLNSLNVENIPDSEKGRMIRFLIEAGAISTQHVREAIDQGEYDDTDNALKRIEHRREDIDSEAKEPPSDEQ